MYRLPPYKPATPKALWDYTMALGAVPLRYRLHWHPRRGAWHFSLWINGVSVLSGKHAATGSPLVFRHRFTALADAQFGLLAISGEAEPTRDGLGWDHALYWIAADEISTIPPIVVEVT